ncbi:MAG: hypothetical protein M2R45_02568 [Verrucomicrobia subdivision 3 bacterium]|nr:hypothetical protein [Limisphaerales bacterium]MCS1414225.1 hypothetical protein [Limisphaerales bacterium]
MKTDEVFRKIARQDGVEVQVPVDGWRDMPFTDAVLVNPTVRLERGKVYSFVDMAAINAGSRCAYEAERREYSGGGSRFQKGDTLMARITPCLENGKIARYCASDASEAAHGSTEFIVISGRPGVTDTEFAYYLTQWKEVRSYAISQMTGTSGRQRVPTNSLQHLTVPIPPLSEQRTIAHILSTLDDKIELNRRMNKTLEAMARAIFKDWFIDFGPTRAKAEGRDPYLAPEIWNLFPDRMQDSELGEIPEGWGVRSLGDAIEILSGGTPRTSVSAYWDGDIPWYTAKDAPVISDIFVLATEKAITQAGIDNSSTKVLPAGTTIITARGTVGRLACLGIPMAMNQTCYGIRGGHGFPDYFTYWNVRNAVNELQARVHGTIFDTITRETFKIAETVLAPTAVAQAFESTVYSVMERILRNLRESCTLTTLRDTLLPKLMTGEVRMAREKG